MSTATALSLQEVVLDALTDAFYARRAEIEECRDCARNPAGVCADEDHQLSNVAALEYEEARKRIQNTPGDLDVLAAAAQAGQREGETR